MPLDDKLLKLTQIMFTEWAEGGSAFIVCLFVELCSEFLSINHVVPQYWTSFTTHVRQQVGAHFAQFITSNGKGNMHHLLRLGRSHSNKTNEQLKEKIQSARNECASFGGIVDIN